MRAHFDSLQEVIKEHRMCTSNKKERQERVIEHIQRERQLQKLFLMEHLDRVDVDL